MSQMRVVVIGAGVGGLSLAHGLQRAGHEVTVLERRADRPQGQGLSLFANGITALRSLGLAEIVDTLAPSGPTQGGIRTPDGGWLARSSPDALGGLRVVHRGQLHAALAAALAPGTVVDGVRAQVVDAATGRVAVRAADTDERYDDLGADVVVAADGIVSAGRAALGLDPGVRSAGYGAWRGVTTTPVPGAPACEVWGDGRRLGIVPLPDGRVYWFAVRDGAEPDGDDHAAAVLRLVGRWRYPVHEIVAATDPGTITWTPIRDLAQPLPTFVRGRAVLLGDAAHAMTPDLGQGGNQALEDAATLAALLAPGPRGAELAAALRRYDALRRPRTQAIARRSRLVGRVAQSHGVARTRLRDLAVRLTPDAATTAPLDALAAWEPPTSPQHTHRERA